MTESSSPPNSDELEPNPEFEKQLDRAFANPRTISLKGRPETSQEDIDAREAYFAQQKKVPENIKIHSFESSAYDFEVSTSDPQLFELLLMQAFRRLEIAKGLEDPGLSESDQLKRTAEHELEHGKMTKLFGHESRYGVAVLYDPEEDTWALSPFHKVLGDQDGGIYLTRLEDAAISVAPEEPSQADLHAAQSAGYTSREEVFSRLSEVHELFMKDSSEQNNPV